MTRYLVTSALPYANGPIHFGHAVGAYIPADVYVRTLRMQGEDVRFICGTDEYGVAITIGAERAGKSFEEYVAGWHAEIRSTFDRLGIEFDIFSGTSTCPHHVETSQEFFRRLNDGGYILKQATEQFFCTKDDMFLADRYVKGTCPKCGHANARGDECPSCGSWLEPLDFTDPRCNICGSAPERRSTEHWYIDLPRLRDEHIGEWVAQHPWKSNVEAFVKNMLEDIRPRPITRDMKWGVPLPAELGESAEGKVLYVWFDAPIGYISMTRELFEAQGDPQGWKAYWQDPDTRLVHFLGKDNIPFHCLVFPSMLFGVKQEYVLPWQVPANEFYNLQGGKFSTSGGWNIPLEEFFEKYDSEVARFHMIASMPETADSEWTWEDFQKTANTALADTIGNLATRVLRFIDKHFDGCIPELDPDHVAELDALILEECGPIADPAQHVREFRFRRAAEQLVANATVANVFVDRTAPWALRKSDPERAASVLNTCCEWISWIARWMVPFMPGKAQALWAMLGQSDEVAGHPWPGVPAASSWRSLPTGQPLGTVEGIFAKIDDATVAAEIEAHRERTSG